MKRLFQMGRCEYSEGFSKVWKAYPNPNLRNRKLEAYKVWQERKMEQHAERVLEWLNAHLQTKDWRKDDGDFIPGMQYWLKGVDMSEPPPVLQTTNIPREDEGYALWFSGGDKGQRNNHRPARECKTPGCGGHSSTRDYCNRCVAGGLHAN